MADQIPSLDAALARFHVNRVVRRPDPCARGQDAAVYRELSPPGEHPVPLPFGVVTSDARGHAPIVARRWHRSRRRQARRCARTGSESVTTKPVQEFAGIPTNDAADLEATFVKNLGSPLVDARERGPTDAGLPAVMQHQPVPARSRVPRDSSPEHGVRWLGCRSRPAPWVSRRDPSTAAGSEPLSPTQRLLKRCADPTAGGRPRARQRESREPRVPASRCITFPSSHVAGHLTRRICSMCVRDDIRALANEYAQRLQARIDERVEDMATDDKSHFLIYRVLGVTDAEGHLIDVYQNKGRFLYRYAGSFLESAAKLCFRSAFPESGAVRIPNTQGRRPKTFEIDCLVGTDALEIKWRDATTDGDHITKEHTRIQAISGAGYTPIRVMFYYPNRDQAARIQRALETLYAGIGGAYYFGDAAWAYVHERTGVDLRGILEELADERGRENAH